MASPTRLMRRSMRKTPMGPAPMASESTPANARRMKVDLSPYPTLTRIEAQCMALEPFAAAAPERQPDNE